MSPVFHFIYVEVRLVNMWKSFNIMHTLLHDDDIGANHGILIGDIILRINIFSDDSTGFS